MRFTWELLITSTLSTSRCVRLHDVWTSRCLRYFDVISRKWCGHDHLQTTFWNINHHYLSYYPSSGEVSNARVDLCFVWVYVVTANNMLSLCPRVDQICHPELGAARSKTPSRNRHSFVWEPLQSRSHCDLDHRHSPHRHVCPRHGWSHQCHRRNQRLLHLYFPWYVNILNVSICVCNVWTWFYICTWCIFVLCYY